MKKLFAILSILFATSISAQEKMRYEDRNIYYQNIAEFSGISSEELVVAIKSMGLNYTSIQLIHESSERLVYNVNGIASQSDKIEGNFFRVPSFLEFTV